MLGNYLNYNFVNKREIIIYNINDKQAKMSRILILGAGISGHTAAGILRNKLGSQHQVTVVSPNSKWNWIPSNIWVGVGVMKPEDVTFELRQVYNRLGIEFHQAKATAIFPEGSQSRPSPFVSVEYTDPGKKGETAELTYDYLINATGPKLNFSATPGLGPDGYTESVCTFGHAEEANKKLQALIREMKNGARKKLLIGTGHGTCTCQGAAFEYIFNVEYELRRAGVRDKAEITWMSNEYKLGDLGIGGLHLKRGGYITHSQIFTESLYTERGIKWITGAAPVKIEEGKVVYKNLAGEEKTIEFDFAMLLPPFTGVELKAYDKNKGDITDQLFMKNAFMKVDADYTPKKYEEWKASDWPATYQNPIYPNIFAAGIAFAPPHQISKPMSAPDGTIITPAPPRTGMPSGMIARAVAMSIMDMIKNENTKATHKASLAEMGAACVASAGASLTKGTAAAITLYPIVPDFEKYPIYGRDINYTFGEIGLGAHWIKHFLHYMFIYKAKGYPGYTLIPE